MWGVVTERVLYFTKQVVMIKIAKCGDERTCSTYLSDGLLVSEHA